MFSDRHFTWGITQTLALQSFKAKTPIWFYNFEYRAQSSLGDYTGAPEPLDFDFGKSEKRAVM